MKRALVAAIAIVAGSVGGARSADDVDAAPRASANALPPLDAPAPRAGALAPSAALPGAAPADAPSSPALALAGLDRQLADLDAEEQAARTELGDIGPKIAEVHARAVLRGRTYYKLTRAGLLPVGGGFDELVSYALRVERARHVAESDVAAERRLRDRGASLAHTLERIARDKDALTTQHAAMDAARLAAADEERRTSAFDRAFATSTQFGSGDYVAVYGPSGDAPATPQPSGPAGFHASKGRLLFPVTGRADVQPARREGTDGPGLEIRAPLGSPVRAVFAGRIAFADRYGPYGRIVIVDHGEHYYTVSGNLASVDVKVGDEISAGERIGTVGDDGHGAMLYFEVRHGAETIAPSPWLGI